MKFVLVVLILYFFINLISAFSWFNFRSNQEPKQTTGSSSTHPSTFRSRPSTFQQQNQFRNVNRSLLQTIIPSNKNHANYLARQRIVNQQRYQFLNTTVVQHQANSINKKSSQIIPQNRFQAIVYQQQHRSLNNPYTFRQINRIINKTNNQIVYPRSHPFLPTNKNNSKIVNPPNRRVFPPAVLTKPMMADSKPKNSSNIKNTLQPFRPRLAFSQAIVKSTKPGLLRALTTKAANNNNNYNQNRKHRLANFYYQRQLRAFYQRINERNAARAHLNSNAALRQRREENEQNNRHPDGYYPMILVRDAPANENP